MFWNKKKVGCKSELGEKVELEKIVCRLDTYCLEFKKGMNTYYKILGRNKYGIWYDICVLEPRSGDVECIQFSKDFGRTIERQFKKETVDGTI